MVVAIESVTLEVTHLPRSLQQEQKFYSKIMPREKNSPGPETVQLFAGLYYMGDIDLPEYPYMARRVHILVLNNYFGAVQHVIHHNPQQYVLQASIFVALSNGLRPSTIYLLLGSRFR